MQYGRHERSGKPTVFDPLRRKWVVVTPEEMVRQHFVEYLVGHLGYPPSLMANEVGIRLNGTLRRCDTVVWQRGTAGAPLMIVEYKAPEVALTAKVFEQISRYCIALRTPYLVVTNGMKTYCCKVESDGTVSALPSVPEYQSLVRS